MLAARGFEVPRQLQQQALLGRRLKRPATLQPLEKIADLNAEHLRGLVKSASSHAVDAFFVLMGLLIGYPDQLRELLLGETEHDPPFAHARAEMPVNILNAARKQVAAPFDHRNRHSAPPPVNWPWYGTSNVS